MSYRAHLPMYPPYLCAHPTYVPTPHMLPPRLELGLSAHKTDVLTTIL